MSSECHIFLFDEYAFDANEKLLRRGTTGEMIPLPPKTCELLGFFIKNAGRLISKDELLEKVWANTFVEESNLTHHITVLRKALNESKNGGTKFIETVPRRGYRFVSPISQTPTQESLEITVSEQKITQVFEEIEVENDNFITPTAETKLISQNSKSPKRTAIYLSFALLPIIALLIFAWFKFRPNDEQIENQKSKIKNAMTNSRLTNSGKAGATTISLDGKLVAYSQNYTEGVGALYIRQTETNIENRLVTFEKGEFGQKAFSSDDAFVFFIARNAAHSSYALYRVPVVGGAPVRLVENLDYAYFALSPDGSNIAVVRHDSAKKESRLVSITLDGSAAERVLVTRPYSEMVLHASGAWSPDGRTIILPVEIPATTSNYSKLAGNLMAFDVSTGEFRKFTEETWTNFGIMRWMPDGSGVVVVGARPQIRNQIYFISPSGEVSRITNDSNGYGNYGLGITKDGSVMVADVWESAGRIWTMDAGGDAKTAVRLPAGNTTDSRGLTTLPDGRIIYSTRTANTFDLWTLGESDTEAKPLTSDAFYDGNAVSSPDGSFIIFASDRAGAGTSHLFRMNTDGSRIEQLTFGEGFENVPDISPDGAFVIYHSRAYDAAKSDWTNSIRKIPTTGGESVQLVEYCFAPSFSPNGKSFACIAPNDNYQGKIVVADANAGQILKSFDVNYYFHTFLPARWTPDGAGLIFSNVENQKGNLWKQNLSGAKSVQLTDFKSELIFNFTFTRDGKRLLISRGNMTCNVVMFKNFR